jgi:hypothetical protein
MSEAAGIATCEGPDRCEYVEEWLLAFSICNTAPIGTYMEAWLPAANVRPSFRSLGKVLLQLLGRFLCSSGPRSLSLSWMQRAGDRRGKLKRGEYNGESERARVGCRRTELKWTGVTCSLCYSSLLEYQRTSMPARRTVRI